MANDREARVCEHPSCNCLVSEESESDYCSSYCEGAGDTTEIACGCGHAGCVGEVSRATV